MYWWIVWCCCYLWMTKNIRKWRWVKKAWAWAWNEPGTNSLRPWGRRSLRTLLKTHTTVGKRKTLYRSREGSNELRHGKNAIRSHFRNPTTSTSSHHICNGSNVEGNEWVTAAKLFSLFFSKIMRRCWTRGRGHLLKRSVKIPANRKLPLIRVRFHENTPFWRVHVRFRIWSGNLGSRIQ